MSEAETESGALDLPLYEAIHDHLDEIIHDPAGRDAGTEVLALSWTMAPLLAERDARVRADARTRGERLTLALRGRGEDGIYRAALKSLLATPRQGPYDDTVRVLREWLDATK